MKLILFLNSMVSACMYIKLVEKIAISARISGKIHSQRANERADFPDSKTYLYFSQSQILTRDFGFLYS